MLYTKEQKRQKYQVNYTVSSLQRMKILQSQKQTGACRTGEDKHNKSYPININLSSFTHFIYLLIALFYKLCFRIHCSRVYMTHLYPNNIYIRRHRCFCSNVYGSTSTQRMENKLHNSFHLRADALEAT